MVQLLIKIPAVPLAASVLLLLITGTFNTILGEVSTGGVEVIKLPAPDRDGSVPLETTLQNRRSVRFFQEAPLSLPAVSQLLWAAQGITDLRGFRTAPSAGALYPLEIYIVAHDVSGLKKGIYLYKPADHTLMYTVKGNYLQALSRAALGQDAINHAPAIFVIGGIQQRTTGKYGERGVHYMFMESGHAAQNICLQAVALDLGAVTIGAFTDHQVAGILKMGKNTRPLYIIPVGKAQ
jgi:SagB-type dehydrogenase family enzyme